MKIGLIGLGRMGGALAHRLLQSGHVVVGFDPSVHAQQELINMGGTCVATINEMPQHTQIIWLMVPAGKPVDEVIARLKDSLKPGAILIDGGNSHYTDTIRRADDLKKLHIALLDCGTSGGVRGRDLGFSLMIGGEKEHYDALKEIFVALAAPEGYAYMGPSGSGHYVKMVHNGIEYALLQSYAEGYHLLRAGSFKNLDLAAIAHVWQHGAIIRSFINELCEDVLKKDQDLENISGAIDENLTGRWTLDEAQKDHIPVDLIERAIAIRAWSRTTGGNFSTKLVALLRNAFGGHAFKKLDE